MRGWLEGGNEVAAFWTSHKRTRRASPIEWAGASGWDIDRMLRQNSIPVVEVPRLKGWAEAEAEVAALGVDTLITCMTMLIVPASLIALFGRRAVNFHPAILPEYRGPSPFLGMMLDREADRVGGLSLHVLTPGIDEGPIIAQQTLPFSGAGGAYVVWQAQQAAAWRKLAREALPAYLDGRIEPVPQVGGSYRRITDETCLGPSKSMSAAERMLAIVGETRRVAVKVEGRGRAVSVKRVLRALGPPTGQGPDVRAATLTMDLADARVLLARNTAIDRIGDRLRMIAALRRLDQE